MGLRTGFTVFCICFVWLATAWSSDAGENDVAPPRLPSAAGVIKPLAPPDTLSIPVAKSKDGFDGIIQDDGFRPSSFELTSRTLFEYHDISGPGKSASFLKAGDHFMTDLELRTYTPLENGWRTELNSNVRFTQSRRYDPEEMSLQYLQFIVADETNTNHLTLGDYYASLSQYSMNRGIKGVGYQRSINKSTYVRLLGGSFHSRWNHLMEDRNDEPIDRYAAGVRIQTDQDRYLLGFNLVAAWDDDSDSVRTTESTYRQLLPTMDWEYRMAGIRLSGEHAYAPTRVQDVNRNNRDISGTANRLNAHATLGNLRLQGRTERVTPDFISLGGGAAIDRLRYYARGDYRLNRVWSIYGANDWYRNNLESQLTATTETTIPEVGVRAGGLFDRRSLSFSSGLRRRIVEVDGPQPRESQSDRLVVSLGDRFHQIAVRGEVELLLNETRVPAPRSKQEDYLYRLVVDSRHLLMGDLFDVRPYLTLEHQETEDPGTGYPVRTNSARFDLRVLTLDDLSFGFNLEGRSTSSDIAGIDDTDEHRYAVNLEKRIDFLSGVLMRLEAGQSKYSFSDSERNYKESSILLSFELLFSKGD